MHIRLLKPGLLSTIQDMGRYAYLSQAVPISGAMDTLSARIANKVIGNNDNAAVIEFTYADAVISAEADLLIACAGDGAKLIAGTQKIPQERPVFIPSGTTVKLINNPSGSRTYLAIAGGWDVPDVLGSKSTFLTVGFGGMDGRALKAGDVLNAETRYSDITQKIFSKLRGDRINYPEWNIPRQLLLPSDRKNIRVVPAREFSWFDGRSVADFLSAPYIIDQRSNRMGYHLKGPGITRIKNDELLSNAVTPGTIQVTGNGGMIILMSDCQTTGGYPRIGQVASVDMPLCAQLKPGDVIYFKEISRHEAEILYIEREQQLQLLTTAVQTKFL
ncbi:biotin-dependent carboxyltransferase family protein [Mucilaginibacter sp. KACC 22773]|uniref:5-oxoprolinase subunit C family protein n=1 Tax=Mucilaginibacter sp. KACC 22773 TaxID=3025671 RepID=UPI00236626F2|nr:biotin-dependent carboxyltransferase family protein [Mucilaginibacter sp. KACC 22773]WDF77193.1 biotin-dependent carboxyltransferase family protein [Mucilaginibacter sp. KACC 22773]